MNYKILTFGCQMNVYDSGRLERHLKQAGHTEASSEDEADLLLVNTCSIRASAESRVYGTLGRWVAAKRRNPELRVVVAGCMAQKEKDKLLKASSLVDLVLGPNAIPRLADHLVAIEAGRGPIVDVSRERELVFDRPDFISLDQFPGEESESLRYPTFVTIMQGCSKVCSYCVVPYTRGPEVCRPPEDVYDEVCRLVDRGYHEVTLIGQNVDSYRYEGLDFADLLVRISRVQGLRRFRFTTSHPQDMTAKLIETVAELENACECFHFPLQAGSDRVLQAMRRGYTVTEYFQKLELLENTFGSRYSNPGSYGISTDLMVGFANETRTEFEETLTAVRRAAWDSAYMFKYSVRERTVARKWEQNLAEADLSARLAELIELQESVSFDLNQKCIGTVQEVLIEGLPEPGKHTTSSQMKGRTRTNKAVTISVGETVDDLPVVGDLRQVRITECRSVTLSGDLLPLEKKTPVLASV